MNERALHFGFARYTQKEDIQLVLIYRHLGTNCPLQGTVNPNQKTLLPISICSPWQAVVLLGLDDFIRKCPIVVLLNQLVHAPSVMAVYFSAFSSSFCRCQNQSQPRV